MRVNQTKTKIKKTMVMKFILLFYFLHEINAMNVLIVLLDDASMSDFSILGGSALTPNVDTFIKSSLYFPNAFSGGVVCSPSRATIQTGRSPLREGIVKANAKGSYDSKSYQAPYTLRDNVLTVGKLLKSQGYMTSYFGKWHLSNVDTEGIRPVVLRKYGYDTAITTSVSRKLFDANGRVYVDEDGVRIPLNKRRRFENRFTDSVLIDFAIEHLEHIKNIGGSHLWYMMLGMHTTHTFANKIHVDPVLFQRCITGEICNVTSKSNMELKYETTLFNFDVQFGKLVQSLKTLNYYDNTMIIFTSDNGLEDRNYRAVTENKHLARPKRSAKVGTVSGLFKGDSTYYSGIKEDYVGGKRSLYYGGNKIGMSILYPTVAPRVSLANVYQGDILPTISEMLGLNLSDFTSETIDGVSIKNVLLGETFERSEPIVIGALTSAVAGPSATCGSDYMSIVEGNFTLITSRSGTVKKLFHQQNDPGQQFNLAPIYPERVMEILHLKNKFLDSLEHSYYYESYINDCSSEFKKFQIRKPRFTPPGFRKLAKARLVNSFRTVSARNAYQCYTFCNPHNCAGFSYNYMMKYKQPRCKLYQTSRKINKVKKGVIYYIREIQS